MGRDDKGARSRLATGPRLLHLPVYCAAFGAGAHLPLASVAPLEVIGLGLAPAKASAQV